MRERHSAGPEERQRRREAETSDAESRGSLLDAIRGVKWPALRAVSGALPGAHHSRLRGSRPELSEYRVYRQGDDPKRIDWRLLARSDRAYIRLAEDRSIVSTLIVVDATASMAFPPRSFGKWTDGVRSRDRAGGRCARESRSCGSRRGRRSRDATTARAYATRHRW